jgi:hypothetical protein
VGKGVLEIDLDLGPGVRLTGVMTDRALMIDGRDGVPGLALGTMFFGTRVPAIVAHACLSRAYEVGARFWDTSNNYAFWVEGGTGDESETCIGDWLASRPPSVREELVIATKLGARPREGSRDLADALGLSRHVVRVQIIDSLRRLRTDRVDLLYAGLALAAHRAGGVGAVVVGEVAHTVLGRLVVAVLGVGVVLVIARSGPLQELERAEGLVVGVLEVAQLADLILQVTQDRHQVRLHGLDLGGGGILGVEAPDGLPTTLQTRGGFRVLRGVRLAADVADRSEHRS